MRSLLKIAFTGRNWILLIFTALSMMLLTISSQLEILTIGIVTTPPENIGQKSSGLLAQVIATVNTIIPISKNLNYLIAFLVFVGLFKATCLFFQRLTSKRVAIRVSRDLRQAYFEHIQSLPLEFYQRHNIGSLSSRVVGDAALIAEALHACIVNYLETPFAILTTFTLCFLSSWKLTLIIFVGCPFFVCPILFLARKVKKIAKQIQKNQESFASILIDFLAGIQTVKVFAMEEFSLKKYQERNDKMAALEKKSAKYDNAARPIIHTIGMAFLGTTFLYGLYFLQMNVSEILVYCGLLLVFYEPIKKFAEENTHIQRGISAAERMEEVMQLRPQIQDEKGAAEFDHFSGPLEFEDVWFRYDETWVLKGVSFKIQKGETVAIVGHTGSGKSTIVQLIPRLYEPQKGKILINGQPLSTFTQKSLREHIAFVPQRPFLFLDTVAGNISFGRPYTQKEIEAAALAAYADEFIQQLPQGYQTELAEAGKSLSGGQQQRLAIARALIKKAPILILDEATSSLDGLSEQYIKKALKQLRGKMTQIIIAHRLSTIEDADKIIYMESGEIIAQGTKDELLKCCPGFIKSWEAQHRQAEALV